VSDFTSVAFLASSIGFGLVVDVCVFTIFKFRDSKLSFLNWVVPVTLFHIILFAAVYLTLLQVGQSDAIKVTVGLVGGILISCLIYQSICENTEIKPKIAITEVVDNFFNRGKWVIINTQALAVSWDAPLSAPSVFTNTHQYQEDDLLVFGLMTMGLTIALFTIGAVAAANALKSIKFVSANKLTRFAIAGNLIQSVILGGFAINSFWHSLVFLPTEPSTIGCLTISITLIGTIFYCLRQRMWSSEYKLAKKAVGI